MALLQILEPHQSKEEPLGQKFAIGIDLGTTNSLITRVVDGRAEVIADDVPLIPSVVHYGKSITVGNQAREMAASDPQNTIISVKRMIGRSFDDIITRSENLPYDLQKSEHNLPLIQTARGAKNAIEVSADILRHLKDYAQSKVGSSLEGAVITVPAYFDDAQRQATLDAAQLAGIKVLRLLNEPTAAAVAYGLDRGNEGIIAVYDLGGGTFDVSILRLSKGVFEVLASSGNTALGGDDFDQSLAQMIIDRTGEKPHNAQEQRQLLNLAKAVKTRLSESQCYDGLWKKHAFSLKVEEFNQAIMPLVNETIIILRRALRDAMVNLSEVDEIVMVGGSTRVPLVREHVAAFFKKAPLTSINPDEVVALGAGIQADVLIGNTKGEMVLLDVVPLSLGIETMGGLVEKIITRNTTIPIAKAQEFTTFKDGQSAMTIHIVQGEREMVKDCRSLGKFTLRGIPPMVAGAAHILVTYQVDADGLLSVSAVEKSTGVKAQIEVKPSYGLTEGEIASMIESSFSHAEDDHKSRRLAEAQLEADRVIESLLSALKEDANLLSEQEMSTLTAALEALIVAKKSDDADAITSKMNALDRASYDFAAKRMNKSIALALSGQNIDEIYQK